MMDLGCVNLLEQGSFYVHCMLVIYASVSFGVVVEVYVYVLVYSCVCGLVCKYI